MGSTTAKIWVILEAQLWWIQEYSSESQFTFHVPPRMRVSQPFVFYNLKYANLRFWKSDWKFQLIDSANKASENREEFHVEIQQPPSLTTKSGSSYYPHWSDFPQSKHSCSAVSPGLNHPSVLLALPLLTLVAQSSCDESGLQIGILSTKQVQIINRNYLSVWLGCFSWRSYICRSMEEKEAQQMLLEAKSWEGKMACC